MLKIDEKRLAEEFMCLLRIDSLSLHEKEISKILKEKLTGLGFIVTEDNAAKHLGSSTGNLIAFRSGDSAYHPILLSAHMDTVAPGKGKNPVLEDGFFHSDGTTILGADNIAAIEIILETLRTMEEKSLPHGDLTIVFSVAEELFAKGVKYLDFSAIHTDYVFVLDCPGALGAVAVQAPSHCNVDFVVTGKTAHAGIDPEKGINAVLISSKAVANMKLGRVDEETTSNIGIISGGEARNTIPDRVELRGEIRSFSDKKVERQYEDMCRCMDAAVKEFGGSYASAIDKNFSAFRISQDELILRMFQTAAHQCGIEPVYIATGGGSDANIYSEKGFKVLNIAIGMQNIHTLKEMISFHDMSKAVELMLFLIEGAKV